MYVAEKDGRRCRIPKRKLKAYKAMGYICKEITNEKPKTTGKPKEAKTESSAG